MGTPTRPHVHAIVASAFVLGTFLATFWRFQRGIDFTDEAFYLALPLRFVLGDRPFIDELNVAQTTAILLYPLIKAHFWLHGTDGIFLFIRLLYLVFFGLVGFAVYRLAATRLPRHAAMLVGAACIPFVPYGLAGLSYNTVGAGMLTVGLATTTRTLLSPYQPDRFWRDGFYWGGAALGAAAFAYPPLLPVTVIGALAVFASTGDRRTTAFVRVAAGGGSFGLLVSPSFILAGVDPLREVVAYSLGGAALDPNRLSRLWHEFLRQHPELPTALLTVGGFAVLARFRPVYVLPLLALLPLLAEGTATTGTLAQIAYVTSFGLLGPLFALGLRDRRTARILTVNAWFPSAVAGALTAWSSGNDAIAAGIGLFPAAIVSGLLLALWVHEIAQPLTADWPRALTGYAPLVFLFVMLKLLLLEDAVYRDGDLPQLTATVTDGPYKGLLTTPERQRMLADVSRDIRRHARTDRALFYYNFTAGYLISAQRPLVASVWMFRFEPRVTMDARFLQHNAQTGDLIFRLERDKRRPNDPIDRIVDARASEVVRHQDYRISIVR